MIIGKKNHPESLGVLSFSGENSQIVEDEEDVEKLSRKVEASNLNKIYVGLRI